MITSRLNAYRIMWIVLFFDLPTHTDEDRKAYSNFRDDITRAGFLMMQYSVYMRHCASREEADVFIKGVKRILPAKGQVNILCITDKQFGMMEVYRGKEREQPPRAPKQLELF
ncbi:MAG: CRISPR-associated endonuclease Cas2 [Chitinophagales bacterium]|nr:CRISPR-associated endonuclease Cas2 [Chitinophagales bacterium]MDW8420203.1 CRISPR-associated endonuclease Cas2 [Chitinophagales bacterium]